MGSRPLSHFDSRTKDRDAEAIENISLMLVGRHLPESVELGREADEGEQNLVLVHCKVVKDPSCTEQIQSWRAMFTALAAHEKRLPSAVAHGLSCPKCL